jgi:hypothetical protein
MARKKKIVEEDPQDLLKVTGYDDCIIGIVEGFSGEPSLLYDHTKMIRQMMRQDGMTREEAHEHFSYNIIGSYMGPRTPQYLMHTKKKSENVDTWIEDLGIQ